MLRSVLCIFLCSISINSIAQFQLNEKEWQQINTRFHAQNAKLIGSFLEASVSELARHVNIDSVIKFECYRGLKYAFNNVFLDSNSLISYNMISNTIENSDSFKLNWINSKIVATWFGNRGSTFQFYFPLNYQLITMKDKKRLDDELDSALINFNPTAEKIPSNLTTIYPFTTDSLFTIDGKVYYTALSSNSSIATNDTIKGFISSKDNSEETFRKFLLDPGSFDQQVRINIHHLKYADSSNITLEYNDFASFFHDGFRFYLGVHQTDKKQLDATLIIYNRELNYMHLLRISTTKSDLSKKNGSFNSSLFGNIPTDNILSLSDEIDFEK